MTKISDLFSQQGKGNAQPQSKNIGQNSVRPRHIAIIMDGNGRWATKRHLPRFAGHSAGVSALRRIVEIAKDEGIEMLSVYAFSTENWSRPRAEVEHLMRLFWETIRSDVHRLHKEGVRLRHLGRSGDLSPEIQKAIRESADLTKENTRIAVNVCFNYGGRAELVDAVRQIVANGVAPEHITEELIGSHLYSRDLPDPDLVIRTGGEMRISNFLLWQSAYSEFYPTPILWPDFGYNEFMEAIESYSQRQRRFGRVMEPPASVAQGE